MGRQFWAENLIHVNRATIKHWAKEVPENCPNCDSPENFTLEQEPAQVLSIETLRHICGWTKDLTPYHLA